MGDIVKHFGKIKLLSAIFALLFPIQAFAQGVRIDNVIVTNTPQAVMVSFEVKDAFTKDIEEAIKSGIPTTFTFFVELYKKRELWFDERIVSLQFRHTVKYDTLKEEYEVYLEENQPSNGVRIKEISKVKDMMVKIRGIGDTSGGIPVIPHLALEKGGRYQLRMKAELDTINLPFPLNYMLFFVSFWDFETDWHVEEFTAK